MFTLQSTFFQEKPPSPLRRNRQWLHKRGSWTMMNMLVKMTHSLPKMAVTMGMMRLPALE